MTKGQLINTMREGRGKWTRLLDEVGYERMTIANAHGVWSVKDVVAYITGWEQSLTGQLKANLTGRKPSNLETYGRDMPDEIKEDKSVDALNAWFVEGRKDMTPEGTVEESEQVFDELINTVQALPESVFGEPVKTFTGLEWRGDTPFWQVLLDLTVTNYEEHATSIRAWLDERR